MEERNKTNTKERSKTIKEIFEQKYPIADWLENPMLCAEAMGYLKALEEYLPSEKWVETEMSALMLALLWHSI